VDENYVGNQVGVLTVIDANTNDEFTYTISGDGAESFEVVDGQLKVKSGTWLDYETKSTYTLTITVTDQGGYSLDKTLTIDVNDVDYGNPWFSEHVSVFDVPISSDAAIRGQQWTYLWGEGSQTYSLRFENDEDPSTPLVITYSLMNVNSVLGDNYDDGWSQGEDGVYSNIENYSADWEAAVDAAFEYWGNVSGITFVKVDDNANMCGDIRIALSSGDLVEPAAGLTFRTIIKVKTIHPPMIFGSNPTMINGTVIGQNIIIISCFMKLGIHLDWHTLTTMVTIPQ
jgi:hypothetical protein